MGHRRVSIHCGLALGREITARRECGWMGGGNERWLQGDTGVGEGRKVEAKTEQLLTWNLH